MSNINFVKHSTRFYGYDKSSSCWSDDATQLKQTTTAAALAGGKSRMNQVAGLPSTASCISLRRVATQIAPDYFLFRPHAPKPFFVAPGGFQIPRPLYTRKILDKKDYIEILPVSVVLNHALINQINMTELLLL